VGCYYGGVNRLTNSNGQTLLSDMKTTWRDFQRNFRRMRLAAEAGQEITIGDAQGRVFVFKQLSAHGRKAGDLIADLIGGKGTGVRVKTLSGYGRHQPSHR